jgi:hypothetical protein
MLTGRETEPWEIIYFKLYKSQIPVIEQAIETAALMLGSDKSRGYCLEMICADFLAGANLDNGDHGRRKTIRATRPGSSEPKRLRCVNRRSLATGKSEIRRTGRSEIRRACRSLVGWR